MKFFESEIIIRRANAWSFSGYDIHQNVEKVVCQNANIRLPYTFCPAKIDQKGQIRVLIRTPIQMHIAGESERSVSFNEGQTIRFCLRYLPYKNTYVGEKSTKRFVQDKIEREIKLINALEKAGLDVSVVDELELSTTQFTKNNKTKFALTDASFFVEATIVDANEFEIAYMEGIGAKASFGYGMIILSGSQND